MAKDSKNFWMKNVQFHTLFRISEFSLQLTVVDSSAFSVILSTLLSIFPSLSFPHKHGTHYPHYNHHINFFVFLQVGKSPWPYSYEFWKTLVKLPPLWNPLLRVYFHPAYFFKGGRWAEQKASHKSFFWWFHTSGASGIMVLWILELPHGF